MVLVGDVTGPETERVHPGVAALGWGWARYAHRMRQTPRGLADRDIGERAMRKVIVYNVISLDGYHTGLGNDVSVMFPMMGGVFDTYNAELLRAADVLLVGRVSFELFKSFWPKVAENPDSEEWTPVRQHHRRLRYADRNLARCPHHQACRRVPADCRTQTPSRQRYSDHRQQDSLERSAGA